VRSRVLLTLGAVTLAGGIALAQGGKAGRLNPMIDLLEAKKPVFGLYAPSNRRFPARPGMPAPPEAPPKSAAELARDAMAYGPSDYIFDGSMEGDFDKAYAAYTDFAKAVGQIGLLSRTPYPHLRKPLIVKAPEIAPDPATAQARIGRQLNLGVSGIMFVSAESAKEVEQGIAAMRFKANGGTRPDDVGIAPSVWGVSEQEYRAKADLWPLNPKGELINWTIVESKEGLAHVREIAAVKGIGVLWPGAGTLRQLFTTTAPSGERSFDEQGWEAAIQQVLAACKEFNVACGFPASEKDLELRMRQGFSVFVMNWGDAGFKTVELGRRTSGRDGTMH
jgi:2-keto-3-deoxy-L-rhamnonate aldolase RhmA